MQLQQERQHHEWMTATQFTTTPCKDKTMRWRQPNTAPTSQQHQAHTTYCKMTLARRDHLVLKYIRHKQLGESRRQRFDYCGRSAEKPQKNFFLPDGDTLSTFKVKISASVVTTLSRNLMFMFTFNCQFSVILENRSSSTVVLFHRKSESNLCTKPLGSCTSV